MKRNVLFILCGLFCLAAVAQSGDMSQYAPKLAVGTAAPEIVLPRFGGEGSARLSDFRGRYVLVDFWATWCGDCRREMPLMREAVDAYRDKVSVLSVSFDNKKEALASYLEKNPSDWTVVADFLPWKESAVTKAYGLNWIPTFYIVDPEGRIAGAGITGEQLRSELQRIFGSQSTQAVIDNIMSRRSIRKYKEQAVPREMLDKILECGINAPNGMNQQNYEVKVVDDTASVKFLSENLRGLYKAPVYLFIAAGNQYDMSRIDVGLLAENICLAANAYGIGSINLGQPVRALKDKPEILQSLHFGADYELCLAIALGYPDETPAAKPRNKDKVQFVKLKPCSLIQED